jgi:hypothetical protein
MPGNVSPDPLGQPASEGLRWIPFFARHCYQSILLIQMKINAMAEAAVSL